MKRVLEYFKDLKSKSYGKAVLFFGFYFVFFAVIIILILFGSKKVSLPDEYELSTPISFKVLKSKNYHFNYNISIDNNVYIFNGDKKEDMELFDYNSKKYYRSNDIYYVLEDSWKQGDNPYKLYKFLDPDNLEKIINNASYDYATKYNNGNIVYGLLISSNTLNKEINSKETDIEEVPNKMVVSVDSKKEIEKIEIYFDNYCKVSDDCNSSLKIILEYSQRGEIKEITNPINS